MNVLLLPGIGNSGPEHWQSLWETRDQSFIRVNQQDWDNPDCMQWCNALDASVRKVGGDTVLVAHSLGCLLVAHWAARTELQVKAALLVAVPDPESSVFPRQATGFAPLPTRSLPFRSIVVASENDPYGEPAFSERRASIWGSEIVNIGAAGHINGASGLGNWDEGFRLLKRLQAC
jgi:predicted alpha/beta hydrolase family esterase